ncbi:basic proline-rich protein-like [Dermacentor silvarum]|uniref:basic proline-rich protein-like n=1 Tax=Dermacentor silvarum TaxID=543639 RepID=UPI00189AAE8D|nr:basic proline-rich protein-like [Dermacentor silvarum]
MTTAFASIPLPIKPSGGRPLPYACAAPTFPSISCGSSPSKIATENQWFRSSGGGSRPQPPPHRSQASRLNSSSSASSAIYGGPGGEAYKTADEGAGEMTRQPVYETSLDTRVKQREPDQGPDRPAQSPAITLLGPQQQPRAGPPHPVPPSPSPPGVSATPGHKGGTTRQPPPQDARLPKRPPHQGSSRSARYPPVPSSKQSQHPMVTAAVAVAIPQHRLPPPEITTRCSGKRQRPLTRDIHHHGRPPPGTPPPGPSPSSAASTQASRRSP